MVQVRWLIRRRPATARDGQISPEKRKVGSSTLPLTTSFGLVSNALTSANTVGALPCLSLSSDHDCPRVTVVGRSLSHADRTPRLSAPGSRPLRPDLAVSLSAPIRGVGCGPCAPPLPSIGLTAAVLFAGGEVSSADSRVRSPGTLTCSSCPAARSALDAGPEAYDNPAAVWWGAFAASAVIRCLVAGAGRIVSGRAEPGRRSCEPRRSGRTAAPCARRRPARTARNRSGHLIQDGRSRMHDSNPDHVEGRPSVFRPDITPVGANRARVMRCRWSLMTAVGCCCCCHRCCQRLVLFPRLTPPDWQRDVLVLVASPACFRRSGRAPSWPR